MGEISEGLKELKDVTERLVNAMYGLSYGNYCEATTCPLEEDEYYILGREDFKDESLILLGLIKTHEGLCVKDMMQYTNASEYLIRKYLKPLIDRRCVERTKAKYYPIYQKTFEEQLTKKEREEEKRRQEKLERERLAEEEKREKEHIEFLRISVENKIYQMLIRYENLTSIELSEKEAEILDDLSSVVDDYDIIYDAICTVWLSLDENDLLDDLRNMKLSFLYSMFNRK